MNALFFATGLMLCYFIVFHVHAQQCTSSVKVDCYPGGNSNAKDVTCVQDGCFWCETEEEGKPWCIRDPICSSTSTFDCFPQSTIGVIGPLCHEFACNWCPNNDGQPWCTYTQATDSRCITAAPVDCFTPPIQTAPRSLCDSQAGCIYCPTLDDTRPRCIRIE